MNKTMILFVLVAAILSSCTNNDNSNLNGEHDLTHQSEHDLEPLAYTIYTEKTELFVEFKPLVVGEVSKFAAHFTKLGDYFEAVTQGKVTVSLVGEKKQPICIANEPSSPGIFRLELKPEQPGKYQLVFDIQISEYTDKVLIEDIIVYPNKKIAFDSQETEAGEEEISYLKEQAWKVEFANQEVKRQPFSEHIKTTGQILPAQGDEVMVIAKNKGMITFGTNKKLVGSAVSSGENLYTISDAVFVDDNFEAKYKVAKINFENAKAEYERAEKLIVDKLILQKDFQEKQTLYENAKTAFNLLEKNFTAGGQKIKSPISGFIKNILVHEGQYVEVGQPIATISQNKRLVLKADVPQKHFGKLNNIVAANFKTAYSPKVYDTNKLNGKFISYAKNTADNSYYVPLNFEIDNQGDLIPGSFIEIFLKTNEVKDALLIPYSALIEEQDNYFAYVQTSGEGFQKRELKIGASNGIQVQILDGIKENERVVTIGAYQIKLATMSGKMPAHGHEH